MSEDKPDEPVKPWEALELINSLRAELKAAHELNAVLKLRIVSQEDTIEIYEITIRTLVDLVPKPLDSSSKSTR